MSDVCQAFGCTPDVAMRQDARLVSEILEYRTIAAAVELINSGEKGRAKVNENEALVMLLREIDRAQVGEGP